MTALQTSWQHAARPRVKQVNVWQLRRTWNLVLKLRYVRRQHEHLVQHHSTLLATSQPAASKAYAHRDAEVRHIATSALQRRAAPARVSALGSTWRRCQTPPARPCRGSPPSPQIAQANRQTYRGRAHCPSASQDCHKASQTLTSMREASSSAVNWQICSPMPAAENVPRCRSRFTCHQGACQQPMT